MYVHNKKNSHQLFVDILPLIYYHLHTCIYSGLFCMF